jgi:hypothetical protein
MKSKNNSFISLYLRMFVKPASTFELLLKSDNKLSYSFYAFLFPALGYTLFYIMAWNAGGAPSSFKPWLNLPIEHYFRYDIFLSFPGYFLGWTSAAVVVFLVSRLMKGGAAFEDMLLVVGFGMGVATWSSMLHDLADAFLATIGVIEMWKVSLTTIGTIGHIDYTIEFPHSTLNPQHLTLL